MSSYDIYFRRPSSSLSSPEFGVYFGWRPFEAICRRVHERATRAGHARLAEASQLYPETKGIDLYRLDAAGWKIVIEEVKAILADANFYAYDNELRDNDFFIQNCQREGRNPDECLRMDRRSKEGGLRHLHDKLTEMVERGEVPSPRDQHCERVRHSDIIFHPLSSDLLNTPAETSASFYGRPFGEICRRIHERAMRLGNARLEEAALYAQLDGFLELYKLDAAEWRLVIEELGAILADADFYAYEKEQSEQAWFIEKCQLSGETAEGFQRAVRESTEEQLKHLREKLMGLVGRT
ncbi:MAG: hypothetical protein K9N47_28665 [Prosthecobacter sp.]|uniref:hypothetical protein n=1 Tax=Prosthecobacter sp. TaxID=1965333 RepID=UPI002636C8FE|nr:hypothetical protein [Prosthecobacter sp.]MCF7790125.1 hypothetical protein [Prosthecobacter sp.]